MTGCCCGPDCGDGKISCSIEKTDSGFKLVLHSDDPKKAEALKKLAEAKQELCCGPDCC